MNVAGASYLENKLLSHAKRVPLSVYLELSHRCPYDCVHCYCKNSGQEPELALGGWKKILLQAKAAGCLWLTFTGGEPLACPEFEELYAQSARLGFLVTVFTTAYPLTARQLALLRRLPPYSIEISVYGRTGRTYESVTRRKGSFKTAMRNIMALKKAGLNVSVKMLCMKNNYRELGAVKRWAERLFGRQNEHIFNFGYDCALYPRLNGDTAPCKQRLSLRQLRELRRQDADIKKEHDCYLKAPLAAPLRNTGALYRCNTWRNQVFISPRGRLKFCVFSEKFSQDLTKRKLLPAFRAMVRAVASAKINPASPCAACRLRDICLSCPAVAELEAGNPSSPVPYFCALTRQTGAASPK